tara:strand:- start:21904 stop:22026 length:123 start_codon:yes stop_codon:yes gene_type:complete
VVNVVGKGIVIVDEEDFGHGGKFKGKALRILLFKMIQQLF